MDKGKLELMVILKVNISFQRKQKKLEGRNKKRKNGNESISEPPLKRVEEDNEDTVEETEVTVAE